jgi:hypothetical protein
MDVQTLTSVCDKSKVTRSTAKYWCAEECKSLSTANLITVQQLRQQRAGENREILSNAIAEVRNSGVGLSRRRIEAQLKLSRRSLLQPEMRELYRDALKNPEDYLLRKIRTANRVGTQRNKKDPSRAN